MMCNPNSFALTHRVTLFQACWLHFSAPVCPPECLSSYRALKYFFKTKRRRWHLLSFRCSWWHDWHLCSRNINSGGWTSLKHWSYYWSTEEFSKPVYAVCYFPLLNSPPPPMPVWMLPYRVLNNTYFITLISRRSVLCSRNVWLTSVTEEVF